MNGSHFSFLSISIPCFLCCWWWCWWWCCCLRRRCLLWWWYCCWLLLLLLGNGGNIHGSLSGGPLISGLGHSLSFGARASSSVGTSTGTGAGVGIDVRGDIRGDINRGGETFGLMGESLGTTTNGINGAGGSIHGANRYQTNKQTNKQTNHSTLTHGVTLLLTPSSTSISHHPLLVTPFSPPT